MSDRIAAAAKLAPSASLTVEEVLRVHHWNEHLFSFSITRPPSFRFRSGEFVMIGLPGGEGRPLLRAYSIASPAYADELEFLSIKVPDGPLTSRLQTIQPGDPLYLGRKPTGTLVADALTPGRRLFMLSTGTGLAPFLSLIKDPDIYERYERVILVHGTRQVAELAFSGRIEHDLPEDEYFGEMVRQKLTYYPTVTREPFRHQGRITELITSNRVFEDVGTAPFRTETDRMMLCGSPDMLRDMRAILDTSGFVEGNHGNPGHFVIEKAFVER